jgi:2-polyprenyl-3-methyl-5-hydroxy-6-metoxy-1,4-benzoquinol methylase/GNAT superfamily N-acetyltransferase
MAPVSSISSNTILVTYAGFEERFYFGLIRTLEKQAPQTVFLLYKNTSDPAVLRNIELTRIESEQRGFVLTEIPLPDPYQIHLTLQDHFKDVDPVKYSCLVDITTTPRDLIFIVFSIIEDTFGVFHYIYNDPGYYDEDWLTRDYMAPEPVLGFSGIPILGGDTTLLILTGFDAERTEQVIAAIEPKLSILGLQSGQKFDNLERNVQAHTKLFKSRKDVVLFTLDSYSEDRGFHELEIAIKDFVGKSNIIVSSLGPKLSAVALYKLQKINPEMAVTYIPSRRVNQKYSSGIGKQYHGIILDKPHEAIRFEWIKSDDISSENLQECATLFSEHYGVWGPNGSRPAGQPVKMSLATIAKYFDSSYDTWVALAYDRDKLVGYALATKGVITGKGVISWITQLVVDKSYRNQKIATKILNSIWGFSDHYAWGIATSSPYAVRALEKATRRRCTPQTVQANFQALSSFFSEVFYLKDCPTRVNEGESVIDSKFHVDHDHVQAQLDKVSEHQSWDLGPIGEGEEWLAVTFREQEQFTLSEEELKGLFSSSDDTVVNAYQGMTLDENHKWTGHTQHEVDVILDTFKLEGANRILDFGAGGGRHAIELAKRGHQVVCVDFVARLVEEAKQQARALGLVDQIEFIESDCRTIQLGRRFDYAICLYDVIGSFADDMNNLVIASNLAEHLSPDANVMISVMNLEYSAGIAKHICSVQDNPDCLLDLPPSTTMQTSGNIFDPDLFIYDPSNGVFYRKEQFETGTVFPCELIVRDKRFSESQLESLLNRAGIAKIWSRYVQAGRWNTPLPQDSGAKEVLFFGKKE